MSISQISLLLRHIAGRAGATLAGITLALTLGACSSLPMLDREAIASEAIALDTRTTLGRIATTSSPAPDLSGFRFDAAGRERMQDGAGHICRVIKKGAKVSGRGQLCSA